MMLRNAVLLRPTLIERAGHVLDVWSDDARLTSALCTCGWYNDDGPDCEVVIEGWRSHVDDIEGRAS